jgi:hypothetical protein
MLEKVAGFVTVFNLDYRLSRDGSFDICSLMTGIGARAF